MNYYVLVEGEGERKIYPTWIKYFNPQVNQVFNLEDIQNNHFYVFCGGGYPYIKTKNIPAAIEDVNNYPNIDKLVIAIDSEELSYQEKFKEIADCVIQYHCNKPVEIIIQYFCLECWGLANQVIFRRHPQDHKLLSFQRFYNVIYQDPELLPDYPDEDMGRVEFAFKYLHKAVNDRYTGITYSKHNPIVLTHNNYVDQITRRLKTTGHINSFENFINAFTP
ncbi:MAG TPA: hypothetical protein DIW44_10105 [Anaerolineaceae bacterium]|nr:hypothetical protein [Anaerolineaceae bacterium]